MAISLRSITIRCCFVGAILFGAALNANAYVGFSFGSHTIDSVTKSPSTWTYSYTLFNDSRCIGFCSDTIFGKPILVPQIRSWDLPWFPLLGVVPGSINSPAGWSYSIETIGVADAVTGWGGLAQWENPKDTNYQGIASPITSATQVLHWYDASGSSAIKELSSLGGFNFDAIYAPTYAPYQASVNYYDGSSIHLFTADPVYPDSPYVFGSSAIPEPNTLALLSLGLLLVTIRFHRASSS